LSGGWQLFKWQLQRVMALAVILGFLLAALAAIIPESSGAGPAPGIAAFVLALLLALMLTAPHQPGATAHLILCGFPRKLIWRATALAATFAGVLCGAGAAVGAATVVESLRPTPELHWSPATPASVPVTVLVGLAGASVGLWMGARLLGAAVPVRLRAQATSFLVAICSICVVGLALFVARDHTSQIAVGIMALVAAVGFLGLSRSTYIRVEPLQD